MKKSPRRLVAVIAVVAALAVVAAVIAALALRGENPDGRTWYLSSWSIGRDIPPQEVVSLYMSDGGYGVYANGAQFSGSVTRDGASISFDLPAAITTAEETTPVMTLFWEALPEIDHWELADTTLTLTGGGQTLTFEEAPKP
ncbi:MAG: META domain-containing protein [Propionibacteriaceae bacterium]|nr:META domain-containing protein [Propionibacteriaceae bacterium]